MDEEEFYVIALPEGDPEDTVYALPNYTRINEEQEVQQQVQDGLLTEQEASDLLEWGQS